MAGQYWTVRAVAIAATVALAACGGGGGGGDPGAASGGGSGGGTGVSDGGTPGGAPAQPVAPSSEVSSGVCTNEADWRVGTVLETDTKKMDGSVTRQVRTTLEREAFAGLNPVPFEIPNEAGGTSRTYSDLLDGKVVLYGNKTSVSVQGINSTRVTIFEPALPTPIDMQPGQKVAVDYTAKSYSVSGGGTEPSPDMKLTYQLTYVGREVLTTALGTFNTCKFIGSHAPRQGENNAKASNIVAWHAVEGPYRGQVLKLESTEEGQVVSTTETVRISYLPK